MIKYGIATLFNNYPDGYEFTEDNTPLHRTHVDAFELGLDPEEFIIKLQQYLHGRRSFEVMPLKDALFGPRKDIPVTIVTFSAELSAFHNSLINFLEANGAVFDNPQFLNDNYAPHISIYGSRRVPVDQPIAIRNVSIGHKRIDIENPPNRIIATIPFP